MTGAPPGRSFGETDEASPLAAMKTFRDALIQARRLLTLPAAKCPSIDEVSQPAISSSAKDDYYLAAIPLADGLPAPSSQTIALLSLL